jgi:RNA polymerase sigma-70 factor (ECF subfamily)
MGKLYDTYFPAINGIICRLTTKNKLVENILEIGFINAWQQIDSFNPTNGSIFTWLLNSTLTH